MEDHDQDRAAVENESLQLRADLKTWEGEWAATHGGRKPGRRDIKQNPDIARKYKLYSKLRDVLAGKLPPSLADLQPEPVAIAVAVTDIDPEGRDGTQQHQHQNHARKRTQSDAALPPQTPSKRARPAQTPRKQQLAPAGAMSPETRTPSAAVPHHLLGTPAAAGPTALTPAAAVPTSVSPTPQKDGRVLGLFDLLSRTPSRSTTVTSMTLHSFSAITPSKHRTSGANDASIAISLTSQVATATATTTATITTPRTSRFATTPQSKRTTRQILFHASSSSSSKATAVPNAPTTPFKTPSTNRVAKLPDTTPATSTPSFLRRRTTSATASTALTTTLSCVDEQDEDSHQPGDESGGEDDADGPSWKKVGPLRLPRKLGVVSRGLSSVVAGLRKMEEEAFADEEEALREMEMGADAVTEKRVDVTVVKTTGEVEVGDSQAPAPHPRNLHQDKAEDEPDPPATLLSGFDNDAVNDSPDEAQPGQPLRIFKKRGQKRTTRLANMRPTRTRRPAQTDPGTEDEDDDDLIPETQAHPSTAAADATALRLSDIDSDPDLSDASSSFSASGNGKKRKKPAAKNEAAAEGVVKRAVRKVKATAHANFKRLKLRGKGAKGGPGHGSRFRRRR